MSRKISRIKACFDKLKENKRTALIPYVTAGFPFANITPELMHGMVDAGADVIELGVPFSDPSADGPVIQKAGDKALALGIGLTQVLAMVKTFRQTDQQTPVVLMGYANPIERYDQRHELEAGSSAKSAFIRDAAAAGVDGVLVVDYPPEECEAFAADLKANGMDLIFLLAPTSTDQRMAQVAHCQWLCVLRVAQRCDWGRDFGYRCGSEHVAKNSSTHGQYTCGRGFWYP